MAKFTLLGVILIVLLTFIFSVYKSSLKWKVRKDPLYVAFDLFTPCCMLFLVIAITWSVIPIVSPELCFGTKEYRNWKSERKIDSNQSTYLKNSIDEWEMYRLNDRQFDDMSRLEKFLRGALGNKYRFLYFNLKEICKNKPYEHNGISISYEDGDRPSVNIWKDFTSDKGIWVVIYESDTLANGNIYTCQSTLHGISEDNFSDLLRKANLPKRIIDSVENKYLNTKIAHQNVIMYDSLFSHQYQLLKGNSLSLKDYFTTCFQIEQTWKKYSQAQTYYENLPYY